MSEFLRQPVEGVVNTGRRAAALTLSVFASMGSAPAHAAETPVPSLQNAAPHVVLSSEDDGAITGQQLAPDKLDEMFDLAHRMGITDWRIMIHPDQIMKNPNDFKNFNWAIAETAIQTVINKGMKPSLVFSCERVKWSEQRMTSYATAIGRQFGGRIKEYAPCNEAGYGNGDSDKDGWLWPMSGYTVEQTQHKLYNVAYTAIKKTVPDAKVLFGEINSKDGIDTFNKEVECMPEDEPECEPIQTDGISWHAYSLESPPDQPSPDPDEAGIYALPDIQAAIDTAVGAGLIETPQHTRPPLDITEIAWMQATRKEDKNSKRPASYDERYWDPQQRKQFYRYTYKVVCRDPRIRKLSFYGFVTPRLDWGGWWNTPFMSLTGKPLTTAYLIQNLTDKYPQCIKPANTSTVSTTGLRSQPE